MIPSDTQAPGFERIAWVRRQLDLARNGLPILRVLATIQNSECGLRCGRAPAGWSSREDWCLALAVARERGLVARHEMAVTDYGRLWCIETFGALVNDFETVVGAAPLAQALPENPEDLEREALQCLR